MSAYTVTVKQETDLEQVKTVAKCLLFTEIRTTPYAPMVIQHPFASSGFIFIPGDDFPIDITKNAENLNRWRDYMSKQIDAVPTASCIGLMLNKTYGLTSLKFAKPYLSREDLSELLADAWIRAENPNMDVNVSKSDLVKMFMGADKKVMMTREEQTRLSELDDKITIYRGVTTYNAKNIKALSWTIDKRKAEWFAHRYGESGKVYKAEMDREKVLAFFMERGESEIIVNPKDLENICAI